MRSWIYRQAQVLGVRIDRGFERTAGRLDGDLLLLLLLRAPHGSAQRDEHQEKHGTRPGRHPAYEQAHKHSKSLTSMYAPKAPQVPSWSAPQQSPPLCRPTNADHEITDH